MKNVLFLLAAYLLISIPCKAVRFVVFPASDSIKYVFHTAGLQLPVIGGVPEDEASKIVANKWNFRFKRIYGCLLDKAAEDTLAYKNREVFGYLTETFGTDWKQRFDNEVRVEYSKHLTMAEWVMKTKEFKEVIRKYKGGRRAMKYKILSYCIVFRFRPVLPDSSVYTLDVSSYDKPLFSGNVIYDKKAISLNAFQ